MIKIENEQNHLMAIKSSLLSKTTREAFSKSLVTTLAERDRGLINQSEFEDQIGSLVALMCGPSGVLEETYARGGGTRFILRNAQTGEALDNFEYRMQWSPDR